MRMTALLYPPHSNSPIFGRQIMHFKAILCGLFSVFFLLSAPPQTAGLLCFNSSASDPTSNESPENPTTTCILTQPSDVLLPPITRREGLRVVLHNPLSATRYLAHGRLLYSEDFALHQTTTTASPGSARNIEGLIRLPHLSVIISEDESPQTAPARSTDILALTSVADLFHPLPVRIKDLKINLGEGRAQSARPLDGSPCTWSYHFQNTLLQDVMDLRSLTFKSSSRNSEEGNRSQRNCLSLEGNLLDTIFEFQRQQQKQKKVTGLTSVTIEEVSLLDWPLHLSRWSHKCDQQTPATAFHPWTLHLQAVDRISGRTALGLLHVATHCPHIKVSIGARDTNNQTISTVRVDCTCEFLQSWGLLQSIKDGERSAQVEQMGKSLICDGLPEWMFPSQAPTTLSMNQVYPPLHCYPPLDDKPMNVTGDGALVQ